MQARCAGQRGTRVFSAVQARDLPMQHIRRHPRLAGGYCSERGAEAMARRVAGTTKNPSREEREERRALVSSPHAAVARLWLPGWLPTGHENARRNWWAVRRVRLCGGLRQRQAFMRPVLGARAAFGALLRGSKQNVRRYRLTDKRKRCLYQYNLVHPLFCVFERQQKPLK